MERKQWKLLYTAYSSPIQKRTIEFLYQETGKYLLREPGEYAIYTLSCEPVGNNLPSENAIIAGTFNDLPLFNRFIAPDQVPNGGYAIRIVANSDFPEKQIILLIGHSEQDVLYAAISFVDDILPMLAPVVGDALHYNRYLFRKSFPLFEKIVPPPASEIRSVFTWGHTINDYQEYIRNLARMKINRLILWNEFPPLNSQEVVDYAHSWGIQVFWGFAWGWSTCCKNADLKNLDTLSSSIVQEWENVWSKLKGDGIYFQSFTELSANTINGYSVAESAVRLVNHTAEKIRKKSPSLKMIFGLHAWSVKNQMDIIAKTDPEIEILWENCGHFPYDPIEPNVGETTRFINTLLEQNHSMGLAFKCQLMMDWTRFQHQAGPYILGHIHPDIINGDLQNADELWHYFMDMWEQHGKLAYDQIKLAQNAPSGNKIEMNLVGNLTGPLRWPSVFVSELFWSTEEPYETILARVKRRKYLR